MTILISKKNSNMQMHFSSMNYKARIKAILQSKVHFLIIAKIKIILIFFHTHMDIRW